MMLRMIRKTACLAALTATVFIPVSVHALDGLSAELGYGEEVGMWRIGLQWEW
jgi:hypothetical protein